MKRINLLKLHKMNILIFERLKIQFCDIFLIKIDVMERFEIKEKYSDRRWQRLWQNWNIVCLPSQSYNSNPSFRNLMKFINRFIDVHCIRFRKKISRYRKIETWNGTWKLTEIKQIDARNVCPKADSPELHLTHAPTVDSCISTEIGFLNLCTTTFHCSQQLLVWTILQKIK